MASFPDLPHRLTAPSLSKESRICELDTIVLVTSRVVAVPKILLLITVHVIMVIFVRVFRARMLQRYKLKYLLMSFDTLHILQDSLLAMGSRWGIDEIRLAVTGTCCSSVMW